MSERKQTGDFKIMVDDIPFASFKKGEKYKVTDLWTGEESVNTDGVFSVKELAACDNVTIRISVC